MKKSLLYATVLAAIVFVIIGIAKCSNRGSMTPEAVSKRAGFKMPGAAKIEKLSGKTDIRNAFVKVSDKVGKSVVAISTERMQKIGPTPGARFRRFGRKGQFDSKDPIERFFEEFFGGLPEREYKQRGLGSGFIIDKEGHILTNYHVVEGADKINITLSDGRSFSGLLKGGDPRSDLAVIEVKTKNLPVAELGDSDLIRTGEWAVALGNPFGHILQSAEPTVTVGVISALHRRIPAPGGERGYLDMIQTDAAINPGNSGGPLCNFEGKVIGINVAIFSTSGGYQGVGFAIPINAAKDILEDLIKGKEIAHGWFGIGIQDITPEIAEYFKLPNRNGVLVSEIMPGGPAEQAGLKEGDIITSLDGKSIKAVNGLMREIGGKKVGDRVRVGITRDKIKKTMDIIVGKRPSRAELEEELGLASFEELEEWRGIQAVKITEGIAAELGLKNSKGVVIIDMSLDGPGYEAGLKIGDVIREINKIKIAGPDDYKKITGETKGLVLIRTDRGYFTVKDESKR
ncbi:MAG: trypsin-like peptidase domain-containing protein [Omnitrophica bacterium]|nr:trypsin-like peptidase domain-containing protein [Candidatus Omnitrophota bacterium]